MNYVEGLTSVEGGYERTGSRSPMQWNRKTNDGFSSAPKEKLYIPQDERADRPDAESQCLEASSLRSEVKRLIALRQAHPALQSRGEIKFLQKGYPLVYERVLGSERILVIINPAQQDATVPLSHGEIRLVMMYS